MKKSKLKKSKRKQYVRKVRKTKRKSKSIRKVRKNTKKSKKRKQKRKTKKSSKKNSKKKKTKKRTRKRRKQLAGGIFGKDWNKVSTDGVYKEITKENREGKKISYIVPKKIIIDDKTFVNPSEIGKGAFGNIYNYENTEEKNEERRNVVVKIGEVEDDVKVSREIEKHKNIKCYPSIIDFQEHQDKDKNMIFIMERLDGDLEHLIKKNKNISYANIIRFTLNLAKILQCLMGINIFYTDLKNENVFYKMKGNNYPFIYLGDLGGGADYMDHQVASFPPYNRRLGDGIIKKPTEMDLSWILGVTLIQMLQENWVPFYWKNIRNVTVKEIVVIRLGLIEKYNNLKEYKISKLLEGTLQTEPTKRLTLQQIQNIIKPSKIKKSLKPPSIPKKSRKRNNRPVTGIPVGIKNFLGGGNLLKDKLGKHLKKLENMKQKYKDRKDNKRVEMVNKMIEDLYLQSIDEIMEKHIEEHGHYSNQKTYLDKHVYLENLIGSLIAQCDFILDDIERQKCTGRIKEYQKMYEHYVMKRVKEMYNLKNTEEIREILNEVKKFQEEKCDKDCDKKCKGRMIKPPKLTKPQPPRIPRGPQGGRIFKLRKPKPEVNEI